MTKKRPSIFDIAQAADSNPDAEVSFTAVLRPGVSEDHIRRRLESSGVTVKGVIKNKVLGTAPSSQLQRLKSDLSLSPADSDFVEIEESVPLKTHT